MNTQRNVSSCMMAQRHEVRYRVGVPTTVKTLSVRVDPKVAADLESISRVDGMKITDVIREAITSYIDLRRGDPDFQERLRVQMKISQEEWRRLAVVKT